MSPLASRRGAGLMLAVSTTMANVLGYGFAITLSRALGPADYGALAALLAAGLVGSVPGAALQLVVARSAAVGAPEGEYTRWLRLSAVIGVVLFAVTLASTPLAERFLVLDGPQAVTWLGVVLLATTMTGAVQGRLLGTERYGRLAASYLLVAGLRFASGLVAAWFGASASGAMAAAAVAALVACGSCAILAGLPGSPAAGARTSLLVRDLAAASSATASIVVLANIDLVLARHFLNGAGSGHYAVGSLFTKAAFWGPHFLSVLAYPRLARHHERHRALLGSLAVTAVIGGTVILTAAVLGRVVISGTAGSAYVDAARLAPAFAALGTSMAILQLTVYSGLARRHRRIEAMVWVGVAAEVTLVAAWLHHSTGEILLAALVVTVGLALVAVVVEVGGARRSASEEAVPALVDGIEITAVQATSASGPLGSP